MTMAERNATLDRILRNSVYLPNSGLIQQLRQGLKRLSVASLNQLELLIGIKEVDAKTRERLA